MSREKLLGRVEILVPGVMVLTFTLSLQDPFIFNLINTYRYIMDSDVGCHYLQEERDRSQLGV